MRTKVILAAVSLLAVTTVQAQGAPPAGAAPQEKSTLDPSPLFKEIDKNNDGKLGKAEWTEAGAPDMVFDIVDANKDGAMTLDELKANAPPAASDTNKDGKSTLAELKAFMATMGGGGAPPAGGAPPNQAK